MAYQEVVKIINWLHVTKIVQIIEGEGKLALSTPKGIFS